jgi:hypothetical protein
VATNSKKTKAIRNYPTPQSVKELRGFFGLTGYYKKIIRNLRVISKSLTGQLKNNNFN